MWYSAAYLLENVILVLSRGGAFALDCFKLTVRYLYERPAPLSLRRRRSKPSVYSVCELVHNIVFESRRVAKKYVDVIDWLFSFAVCD